MNYHFISSCLASMPQFYIGGDINISFNGGADIVLLLVVLVVIIARTKRYAHALGAFRQIRPGLRKEIGACALYGLSSARVYVVKRLSPPDC